MSSRKPSRLAIRLILVVAILASCRLGPGPTATPRPTDSTAPSPTSQVSTATSDSNQAPTARNSTLHVQQETTGNLDLAALVEDPDGDSLTFSITRSPQHGTPKLSASQLEFTPATDYLGPDQLTYQVRDGKGGTAEATIELMISLAPPLHSTGITDFESAIDFLYSGDDPLQTGVEPDTIDSQRVAVLRGTVQDLDGNPLEGVMITVLDHPEYGETLTRADGMFDLAVNGGGWLTINYEKEGLLPAQRKVEAPWQDYSALPEVILIAREAPSDPSANRIDLSEQNDIAMQVARGNVIRDSEGTRQETLLFPKGTVAQLTFADGSTRAVEELHVFITEYTVGPNGEKAMPGELPPTSAYTYAVEYAAQEEIAAGATSVVFDPPIISYTENFLGFPVGAIIPTGYYDRDRGAWVANENGHVVKLLSITDGKVDLDIDGSGVLASSTALSTFGISDAEREILADLYENKIGQSFWRGPVPHFSQPKDLNPSGNCEAVCRIPSQRNPQQLLVDEQNEECASIIGCELQTLGQALGVVGTPYQLVYQSNRVIGNLSGYSLEIPVSGEVRDTTLLTIDLTIQVAGNTFKERFGKVSNETYSFHWDGKDAFGRQLEGPQPITTYLTYIYPLTYIATNRFANVGSGTSLASDRINRVFEITVQWTGKIGNWVNPVKDLGGWSLDVHHTYDPEQKILYLGNGDVRGSETLTFDVIQNFAGNVTSAQTGLNQPRGGTVAPDGSFYFADWQTVKHQIKKVDESGNISPVAGGGINTHDGIPATEAKLNEPQSVALLPDGGFVIGALKDFLLRRVDAKGIITTIAGMRTIDGTNGVPGYSGDGGPATTAKIGRVLDVAIASDGTIYFVDQWQINETNSVNSGRIRRIGTDGIISTVAGGGDPRSQPAEGRPATDVYFPTIQALALAPDGSLYFAWNSSSIGRVDVGGTYHSVVNRNDPDCQTGDRCGDGGPALQATIRNVQGLDFDRDGNLYIADTAHRRIRQIAGDGIIRTFAGSGIFCLPDARPLCGDGGSARQAEFMLPVGVSVGPDGSLYITDNGLNRVRKVVSPLPGGNVDDIFIPSEGGSEIYVFSRTGQHLRTLHALTGAVIYRFLYMEGLTTGVEDGDGNLTEIDRDAHGTPLGIIAPFGQTTTFTLDTNGYLGSISNPAQETIQFEYTPNGLMTSLKDALSFAHTFKYDPQGRLERDEDPLDGFTTLARTNHDQGYSVVVNTALNRPTTYSVERLPNDTIRRVVTYPDGTQSQEERKSDGSISWQEADGTQGDIVLGPDPRWGMLAPISKQVTLETPGGLSKDRTVTRTTTLNTPGNPFSIKTLTNMITINGQAYQSTYTGSTRTWVARSPEGRTLTTTIDEKGRMVFEQVAGLAPVIYTYDGNGRLETATCGTAPDERKVTFTYNTDGYLASITTAPLVQRISFEYDAAGRILKQTLPGEQEIDFTYYDNGNLQTLTPPGKTAHTFEYTKIDLREKYIPPDVNTGQDDTQYEYDADRQLRKITRPDGKTIEVRYDTSGRLDALNIARGIFDYEYDTNTGNLETIDAPNNIKLAYGYDGELLQSEIWSGSVAGAVLRTYDNNLRLETLALDGSAITYSYDNDGLLEKAGELILTPDPLNGLLKSTKLGAISDTFEYTTFGEVDVYHVIQNNTGLFSQDFDYDGLGRITKRTETIQETTHIFEYVYDDLGRLFEVKRDGALQSTYRYDSNGNREGGTYDAQDRMTKFGANTYTYTPNGELETRTTNGQTTEYEYDELGSLIHVSLPGNKQIDYLIDGQGRRVGKKVDGVLKETFFYEAWLRPIAQFDNNGSLVARFIYTSRPNVPEYMVKDGMTYRFILDHLGSPRLIIKTTDGTIAQKIEYDEFGRVLSDSQPGFQPFGFAGGLYDPDTGLVRFGLRDYDAEVGRWITKDPAGLVGGMNLYVYANNNPMNFIDATGLLAGAAVGFQVAQAARALGPVGAAFAAGYAIGTGINYFVEDSIQAALTRFLPDEPTTTVQLPKDLYDRHKEIDYQKYNERCKKQKPPPGLNKCEDAKWRAAQARDCALMRMQWDRNYYPGRHNTAIDDEFRREANALKDVAKYCPPPSGCS